MRFPLCWAGHRRGGLAACLLLASLALGLILLSLIQPETREAVELHVSPAHRRLVHEHVRRVLEGQCRPSGARQNLQAELPPSSRGTRPFLWRVKSLSDDLFVYPPPFGLRGLRGKVEDLLQLLPAPEYDPLLKRAMDKCHRCVVVGNGGILKGLKLGPLIDRFDTIIRLNSGPLGEFSVDVGNRTSIRMSYPEGTPHHWVDTDPHAVFVAVVYKRADLSWIYAMINRLSVPLWDWIFFWQKVPKEIPLEPSRFRLLSPHIIRETALDLLKYPQPRQRLWGWDQNVPTLGVAALNLASLLCDEVSLVGFGYNLSHQGAPLHYYDHLPMSLIEEQKMHNVNQETRFLQRLVREGTITDLTGGVHCSFCSS
ncbi:lactosylceramide alpha-2,3-sialyltransferase [Kryptolebias marmoratus]|uniref:Lactosylceramide alpha-2,3-sialyltransferase n=1 Tax=Kryptolebias marmoratus TaxID=37003 RepID=A0A3Q3A1B5_KRYMA|nr:lactosylceramide alpha-2,3-sialyltransferase [Kryptolebias marmoratus]XP_017278647.1 lactosylceramide alpha-2,3-sialyltransferase [Kryptolebias marmoratus]